MRGQDSECQSNDETTLGVVHHFNIIQLGCPPILYWVLLTGLAVTWTCITSRGLNLLYFSFITDKTLSYSGRVITPFDLVEPEETQRGCSWPFLSFLGKNIVFGSIQNLGPCQPNHYER